MNDCMAQEVVQLQHSLLGLQEELLQARFMWS